MPTRAQIEDEEGNLGDGDHLEALDQLMALAFLRAAPAYSTTAHPALATRLAEITGVTAQAVLAILRLAYPPDTELTYKLSGAVKGYQLDWTKEREALAVEALAYLYEGRAAASAFALFSIGLADRYPDEFA